MGSRRRLSCALLILVWSGVFATLVLVPGHPRRSRHDTVTTQGLPCGVAGSDRAQHLGRFASLTSGTSAADRTARVFARLATNLGKRTEAEAGRPSTNPNEGRP